MKESKRKRRARSRSRDSGHTDKKLQKMQEQLHNLTEVVARLAQTKDWESTLPGTSSISVLSPAHMGEDENSVHDDHQECQGNKENISGNTSQMTQKETCLGTDSLQKAGPSSDYTKTGVRPELLEILGDDPNASNELHIQFNTELKNRWQKWMQDGFPMDNKKPLMEKYPKKGDFYTEAPKLNPEITALMTEIAVKRDKHFETAQNCIGAALSALGAAVSLILEDSEEGVDQEILTQYLCDAGKLISDVFYQQTVARKSFITPTLNKTIRPTLDATKADKWLYGSKFVEQVNEVKSIEKACASLKVQEKPMVKSTSYKHRDQGNSKYPPAKHRQVGNYTRRPQIKFKTKYQRPSQNVLKTQNRKPYQSSRK